MIELKNILPMNPFFIPAEEVNEILQKTGLQVEELLIQLIPIAKSFARPPISHYQVGEAALGKSGNIYLGVNIEFLGLPLNAAIHGEQFLVTHARQHGETEIVMMALPAAPCGHCRQFLNEIDEEGQLKILIPNLPPKALSSLLPHAFGPKDLHLTAKLLEQPPERSLFSKEPLLIAKAMQAAVASYAPYSQSKSGVAIQTRDGKIYTGSYLENAAFNPSLSPLQTAIVSLVADLREYKDISEVVLVEQVKATISQEIVTRDLLSKLAPKAQFRLEKRDL
jgi:cytidine deaminase